MDEVEVTDVANGDSKVDGGVENSEELTTSKPGSPVNETEGDKPGSPTASPKPGSGKVSPSAQEAETKASSPATSPKPETGKASPVGEENKDKPASPLASPKPGSGNGSPTGDVDKDKPASPKPGSGKASPVADEEKDKPASAAQSPKPGKASPVADEKKDKPGSGKVSPAAEDEQKKQASPGGSPKPGSGKASPHVQDGEKPASPVVSPKPGSGRASPDTEKNQDKPASPKLEPDAQNVTTAGTTSPKEHGTEKQNNVPLVEDQSNQPAPPAPMMAGQTEDSKGASDDTSVPTAPPVPDSDNDASLQEKNLNALNLVWSFGMSYNIPVINMSTEDRKMIAYACGHTGVLYDINHNTQMLLQGHANSISSMCVSEDHHWLATADIGADNMIIIWDSTTGNPVRTMFEPHPDGAIAMAMTPDARYLVSISLGREEEKQTLAIWDWTVESDLPLCTAELDPSYGTQNYVLFNPADITQLVSNSDSQVIFYSWKSGQLIYYAPPLTDDDFNKPVGKFSQSIFMGDTSRALTATSLGNLVVWDTNKPLTKVSGSESTPDKKALKLVKLQDRGFTVLTTADQYIVMGDVLGHVKFFDQTLKLMNWYQDFHLGSVNSLSFSYLPDFESDVVSPDNDFPQDATIKASKFFVKEFVIGTTRAVFAYCFTDGSEVKVIHSDHDAAVHGIDSHPKEPKFVVGSYSGLLKVWDYEKKDVIISKRFDHGMMIQCCSYDPSGDFIAVGFTNGALVVVDALTLNDLLRKPFHYARDAITNIAFSLDSAYLATADAEYTTTLYKRTSYSSDPYVYMGRYRAHYKTINSLLFGKQLDGEAPRLLSLSEDRHLVEYELENEDGELRVLNSDRIEQSAIPYCMAWYPPVTKESFLMTANDQYKLKLYNSTTKMCRKTLLGPTYGSPVKQLVVLPSADPVSPRRYMAYITDDKIGLQILPLDGNPHNAMALMAHPLGASRIVSSYNGQYVFTAGGSEAAVHMWNINTQVLEAQSKLGGEDLVPFYGLLEGGRDGDLFKELEDYFYYAQIRSQGVDTTESRKTSVTIPLSEIPFVMRAMGFYPSEQEIEDMKNEVKYSDYVETGQYKREIDLGEFIKLYINHRPAFGLQPDKLQAAFDVLGIQTPEGSIIDRGELLDVLQNRGEHIKEYDLAEYLMTLLGYTEEGGSSELHQFDTSQAGTLIDQSLPQDITPQMFADDLLGFGLYGSNILQVDDGQSTPQQA